MHKFYSLKGKIVNMKLSKMSSVTLSLNVSYERLINSSYELENIRLKFVWYNFTASRATACKGFHIDPSAAAERRIRRRKFVRWQSAGKITASRISRRILLAVNPP